MPQELPAKPSQIVILPTNDLYVPDWNPRKSFDEDEMQVLMNFIKSGGTPDRITAWKGNGQAAWAVISGQRRLEAYKRLGWEKVEVEILDITLEEAKRKARTANRGVRQHWLDDYESWEPYFKDPRFESQEAIAAYVGVDSDRISRAVRLLEVLNEPSRKAIRQFLRDSKGKNDAKNKGNIGIVAPSDGTPKTLKKRTPENIEKWEPAAKVLLPLLALRDKRNLQDTQALVQQAIPVILAGEYTSSQTKELVAHLISGGDPAKFEPTAKTPKAKKTTKVEPSARRLQAEGQALGAPIPGDKGIGAQKSQGTENQQPEVATSATAPIGAPPRNDSNNSKNKNMGTADLSPGVLTQGESLLWDGLLGVSMVSRIKSKIKKGERPTWWEFLILAGAALLVPMKWIGKHAWKALKWTAKELFHLIRRAARGLAKLAGGVVGGVLEWVLMIGLVLLLIWGAYEVLFEHRSVGGLVKEVVMWPVHWAERKFTTNSQGHAVNGQRESNPSTVNSEIPLYPPLSKGETNAKPKSPTLKKGGKGGFSRSAAAKTTASSATNQSEPWQLAGESKDNLESEIDAVRGPGRIKAFPVQPVPMGADMSIRRLGDLRDPEKYSLIVGHDKQNVLSVSPAMTGLTLAYGGGLPIGGILGGPSKIEFYWEDVRAIHCDEIEIGSGPNFALGERSESKGLTNTKKIYQCGLVVNGLKKPFIVQCATPEGLGHLVSALEFWIGAGNQGRLAPISGMPYLSQGLRMDQSGKVELLWADSPGDLAAQLGDGIWSLDSDSPRPLGKSILEAALDSLASGKHYLYVAASKDWGGGPPSSNNRFAPPFNPERRRMELLVP